MAKTVSICDIHGQDEACITKLLLETIYSVMGSVMGTARDAQLSFSRNLACPNLKESLSFIAMKVLEAQL